MINYETVYVMAYDKAYNGNTGTFTKAHAAALAAVREAAKAAALAPILALHKAEKRFYPASMSERSFDTAEKAREYADGDDDPVESFEICAECGRVESDQLREYADDWGYRESLWPCRTFRAIQTIG